MHASGPHHIVHASDIETVRVQGEEYATVQREVVELTGDVPLWAVRSRHPDGASKAPVVLIHGFAQNRYSWHTTTRSLSAYLAERGWDVWNLELRGHGRSRSATTGRALEFADYVADITRFAAHLPEPGFWVGHSLGASVAYAGAAAQVDGATPRGVVGIGGVYRFAQHGLLLPAICRLAHRLPKSQVIEQIQVNTRVSGRLLSACFPLMDTAAYWSAVSGWWPGSVEEALATERMTHGFDWIPVRIWHEMAEWSATDHVPWDEDWRTTDVPVYVVLGDKDSMQFPDDGRAAFDRSGSQDKTLRIFNDYDDQVHWGHLDLVLGKYAPEHVWPAIDEWMSTR
jgi:polyhydroxyalkanoate synthase